MIDYEVLTAKIKLNSIKNGSHPNDIKFGEAKISDLTYLTDLYDTYSYWSQFYRDNDLESLRGLKVPQSVVEFYAHFEPKSLPLLNGGIGLLDLAGIKEENSSGSPGLYLIKYGIITVATTIGGHSICLDINHLNDGEPRVIIIDYTFCTFNDDLDIIECLNGIEDIEKEYGDEEPIILSYEIVKKCCSEIAATFSEFLKKISNEEYPDLEDKYIFKTLD
jgi:hypothetical protein